MSAARGDIRDRLAILGVVALLVVLPLPGVLLLGAGGALDLFRFPPLTVADAPKAGFSLPVFLVIAALCALVCLVYLVPRWLGFARVLPQEDAPRPVKRPFPLWFWLGAGMLSVSMFFLWGKLPGPRWITDWLLVPLFWGIVLALDGWTWARSGGRSLLATRPRTLAAMAVCSFAGWWYLEYLNLIVRKNWYYPLGDRISTGQFLLYSGLGSSALLTVAFQWYSLLRTFDRLALRYSRGPVVRVSRRALGWALAVSLLVMFLMPFAPDHLFFAIWLAPTVSLLAILELRGKWTPLLPMSREGSWAPFALICLSYLIQGLLHELWNYFGTARLPDGSLLSWNPAYWVYSVPYVDTLHVFEMPLLGYFGYLPFGLYCWCAWLAFAHVLGLEPDFDSESS